MKSARFITLMAAMLLSAISLIFAQDSGESEEEQISIPGTQLPGFTIWGRLQTLGFMQSVNDSYNDKMRLYLFLKQARLGMYSSYDDVKIDLQLAFGGEEEAKAPSPGVTLSLLDLSADIRLNDFMSLKVGQFKVPYSREELTNSGYLQFTDRSIQHLTARLGRDVGFALYGNIDEYSAAFGIFTGGGRDVPIRSIPQDLGIPMIVLRAGLNVGYDKDMFKLQQATFENGTEGYAIFVSGLFTKDSKIGHSTALNVKLADKSLLLNSNWNPYIAKRPFDKGEVVQLGADAAYRTLVSPSMILNGEAEMNYGFFKNAHGRLDVLSGRIQGGLYHQPWGVAIRYAFIKPDGKFSATDSKGVTYNIINGDLIHELALSISYFLKGDRVKLTAELPILFGAPVVTETNIGAYVVTQQPDQVTYIAAPTNAKVERQTVVDARMQLQVMF